MSERMTTENQIPATLAEEIEIMVAVGGLSPAQKSTFKRAAERIEELEEENQRYRRIAPGQPAATSDWLALVGRNEELKRKYEALVDGINSAQSHTAEALRLLQWDQLGWDVPEEVIESLGNADSELRALLEDDDE